MVVVILSYYNKAFLHLHTLASCQALRKGEGEGKESLVATFCACADFPRDFAESGYLPVYVRNTKRHGSKYMVASILLSCPFRHRSMFSPSKSWTLRECV